MDVHLEIFRRIANSDVHAYEILFKEYYKFLCSYAFGLTKDRNAAEEIVEDFFVELWNNRQKIHINTSVRSYFVGAIHNRCLNYLQREKPKYISSDDISVLIGKEGTVGDYLITPALPSLLAGELEQALSRAIEMLPANCRDVFKLSRFSDMSYEEVAKKLDISVNTVKTQMKIALRKLREILKDYLVVFLFFVFR